METDKLLQDLTDMTIKLKSSESSLEKMYYIQQYFSCKDILKTIYDPQIKFNVSSTGLLNYRDNTDYLETIIEDSLFTFLSRITTLSGHKLFNYCLDFMYSHPDHEVIILLLLNKNLKCGISIKTINNTWSNLIPEFSVPLAKNYEEGLCDFEKDDWYVSQKVDGVRCLVFIYESGEIKCFTRKEKELFTLSELKKELEVSWIGQKGIVLDGEIFKKSFKTISREVRRKNHTIKKPQFLIFDCYPIKDFYSKVDQYNFIHKYHYIKEHIICSDNLKVLKQTFITSTEHFLKVFSEIPEDWEGLILRKNEPTLFKRSKNLLKVKRFNKEVFQVTGIHLSQKTINNNKVTCCGALTVIYKNQPVNVGSGLSDQQRVAWQKEPNLIVDKEIVVKYFSESFDKDGNVSLLFPTLYQVL